MRTVFGADEQSEVEVDVLRWIRLARMVLDQERVPEESEAMRKRERELLARFRELEQEEGR